MLSFQATLRSWHSLYNVGMSSFRPLVPAFVGGLTEWLTLIFVNIFGAFRVVENKGPGFILKIVPNLRYLRAGSWNDDIGGILPQQG